MIFIYLESIHGKLYILQTVIVILEENVLYAWPCGVQLLSWGNDCARAASSLLMFMSANMATRMTFCSCHSVYKLRNRCRVPTFHPTQDTRVSWHCIIINVHCTIIGLFFSYQWEGVNVIQKQNKHNM